LRNNVEVERRNCAARTRRAGTLAVDQNQRARVTAAAKVDRLGADTAIGDEVLEGVVQLGRAGGQRRTLQEGRRVDEAFENSSRAISDPVMTIFSWRASPSVEGAGTDSTVSSASGVSAS
jgi:chromosome condensin MukBEF MukE localization factor